MIYVRFKYGVKQKNSEFHRVARLVPWFFPGIPTLRKLKQKIPKDSKLKASLGSFSKLQDTPYPDPVSKQTKDQIVVISFCLL